MTTELPEEDSFFPEQEPIMDEVEEVILGDLAADDARLSSSLEKMKTRINNDNQFPWHYVMSEYLSMLWSNYGSKVYKKSSEVISLAVRKFTDIEVRKTEAKHKGRALEKQAEGDKTIKEAQAEKIKAEADVIKANAEEERARTRRKDQLVEKLLKGKITFAAEERDGILRVLFTKENHLPPPMNDE